MLIDNVADLVTPFKAAPIEAVVLDATSIVLTVNVADVFPAGTTNVAGKVADFTLLVK